MKSKQKPPVLRRIKKRKTGEVNAAAISSAARFIYCLWIIPSGSRRVYWKDRK